MKYKEIFSELSRHRDVFDRLLRGVHQEIYLWRPAPDKWCLLEILCHLHDEEREDFRTRVRCTLETPEDPPPPINPVAWVKERNYIGQDYEAMLDKFLAERAASVTWLQSLDSPDWSCAYQHPRLGPRSAHMYLINWLAHDYFHIRQIVRLKFRNLQFTSGDKLSYAGNW